MSNFCANCGLDSSDTSFSRCSRCKNAFYCSSNCQVTHWPVHRGTCRRISDEEVWAVEILSDGEADALGIHFTEWRRRCRYRLITMDHPIFSLGEECHVSSHCGFPLTVYSHRLFTGQGQHLPRGDCQPAVYLKIDPHSGFAPFYWQLPNMPGTCIVMREDMKPLRLEALEMILEFHKYVLDVFGERAHRRGWDPMKNLITKRSLQRFAHRYYHEQREGGRLGFGCPFDKDVDIESD